MSLTNDIKSLIPTGVAAQVDIFRFEKPDSPDNLLCIYQTGGTDSAHSFDKVSFEQPSFQIIVRNTNPDTAIDKANVIKTTLDGLNGLVINSNLYVSIFLQGDILPLGKDNTGRYEVSINFNVKVKRA